MIPAKSFAEVRRLFPIAPGKVFAAFARADLVELWLTPDPEPFSALIRFAFCIAMPVNVQCLRRAQVSIVDFSKISGWMSALPRAQQLSNSPLVGP